MTVQAVQVGVTGNVNGVPTTWRPTSEMSWSEQFGDRRTQFGALHRAYTSSVPAQRYVPDSHLNILGTLFGRPTLDGFHAEGASEHRLPMAVIDNSDRFFGGYVNKHMVMPMGMVQGADGHDVPNVGMPAVGERLQGGFTKDYGNDAHGRIVAMLDRRSIAHFDEAGNAIVRSLSLAERAAYRLGPLGVAAVGVGTLGALTTAGVALSKQS